MNKLEKNGISLGFCEKCGETFWDFGEIECPNLCGTILKKYRMKVEKRG